MPRKIIEQTTIYFYFLFFRENNAWHYMWRRFTCNVKHYFLWRIQKNILRKCCLQVMIGALRVNHFLHLRTLSSCLLLCAPSPFKRVAYSIRKDFVSPRRKFLPFKAISRQKVKQESNSLLLLQVFSISCEVSYAFSHKHNICWMQKRKKQTNKKNKTVKIFYFCCWYQHLTPFSNCCLIIFVAPAA